MVTRVWRRSAQLQVYFTVSATCQALISGKYKGGSQKNKPERRPPRHNYLVNNLKENYEHIHVSSCRWIDYVCMVYFCGDIVLVAKKTPVLKGIFSRQTDSTIMRSSHITLLSIPQFLLADFCLHVLPYMNDHCLICVGKLCDDRFAVNFDANYLYLKGILPLIGNRDHMSVLYYIYLYTPTNPP